MSARYQPIGIEIELGEVGLPRPVPAPSRFRRYFFTFVVPFLETFLYIIAMWFWDVLWENKYCNFLFRCGCTWNWDGGWDKCNVHNATGPRCPFCAATGVVAWLSQIRLYALAVFVAIFASQSKRLGWREIAVRWVSPLLLYFPIGFLLALIFKIASGYPSFVF
jgi:hypothetical protein